MKLYQDSIGRGPDLVLLHGWGMHSAIWSTGADHLAGQLARHYRVTMIDLPGHGLSDSPHYASDHLSFDAVVDQISAMLPPSTLLLGWSLGGLLAQRLAQQHPQQISRLLLLASTARFTRSHDWPAAMSTAVLHSFGSALLADPDATVQRFLALQVHGSDNERQQLQLFKQALSQRPAARRAALDDGLHILGHVDLRPQLAAIPQPTLLIYGQHDRIVPANVGSAMCAQLPQARSLIIKGAGHAPFLSHPQQTGQAILEFLND